MVLTGLALNHSDDLNLDEIKVSPAFLLDWYGLSAPDDVQSYRAGDHWLSVAGSELFFDSRVVTGPNEVVGVSLAGNVVVVAGNRELLLFDPAGLLIEKVAWEHPDPIDSIGTMPDGTIAVGSRAKLWQADSQLLGWRQVVDENTIPVWSTPRQAPKATHDAIIRQYRGPGLSLERVLLDLHSGRILGRAGTLIVDLLALAVGFLAVSGLFVWARGRKNGKSRRSGP